MKIGFTGTQRGMTTLQSSIIGSYFDPFVELHHGDCIGADQQAHDHAKAHGSRTVIHPPILDEKRAWCQADITLPERYYIDRNHDIVDCTELLLVAPHEFTEQIRSGTWATFRYARRNNKKIIIIYPDGLDESVN